MQDDTILIMVDQPFKFAHRGVEVEAFEPSDDPRPTTHECAELAIAEGWARAVQVSAPAPDPAPAPATRRGARSAPDNKDAAPQRNPADPA